MGVRGAGFETVQALISVNWKYCSGRLPFALIQPGMVLVIAAHKDQLAVCLCQYSSGFISIGDEMLHKTQLGRVPLGVAQGCAIKLGVKGKNAHIARL